MSYGGEEPDLEYGPEQADESLCVRVYKVRESDLAICVSPWGADQNLTVWLPK